MAMFGLGLEKLDQDGFGKSGLGQGVQGLAEQTQLKVSAKLG